MKNKKGLSQIIAVVILIMLSMASVSILFPVVRDIASSPEKQLAPLVSCLDIQASSPEIKSAVFDDETGELEIRIEKTAVDDYTTSFDFIVSSNQDSERFTCGEFICDQCVIQNSGETKTFYLKTSPGFNAEEVTLIVNSQCEVGTQDIL